MKKSIYLSLLLIPMASTHASVITSDTTSIISSGQSYNSSITLSDTSYSDVVLNLEAKGDYGYYSSENISFYIDGTLLADWTYSTSGITVTKNYKNIDYTLLGSVSISEALWSSFTLDNILDISWVNDDQVNPFSTGGADYVTYSVQGNSISVPTPASLALLGLGLFGFGMARRKKSS
tara:strand:- start:6069 stop:6602 length:534 start_codon:yes stop_codon:yes gene_type:complete